MPLSAGYLTRTRYLKYLKKDPRGTKWKYEFDFRDPAIPWTHSTDKRISHVIDYGEPALGYRVQTEKGNVKFVHVPEMSPKLVIPDLNNFNLRPYMSLSVDNDSLKETSEPLSAKQLYDEHYSGGQN